MPRNDRLLTVAQAAARAKCDPETIRRHIRLGHLGEVHRELLVPGRPLMISEVAVMEFIARQHV